MKTHITEYKTDRDIAWRNLMVIAINEGIKAKILTANKDQEINGRSVEFAIAGLGQTIVTFDSIEYGEVSVEVVVDRKDKTDTSFTKFPTGAAAKAQGFLNRDSEFYLQPTPNFFQSKKPVQQKLYALKVEPNGYEDIGRRFL